MGNAFSSGAHSHDTSAIVRNFLICVDAKLISLSISVYSVHIRQYVYSSITGFAS
jgi:hypothetical protein